MIILFILGCLIASTKEQKEANRIWQKCASKASGSQPECWDEKDWEVFCAKVECKR